ncbi:MAG TPA: hypothetical protein VGF50_01585 [Caulobacteraceae bacterium]|jgi:hypothetical protein
MTAAGRPPLEKPAMSRRERLMWIYRIAGPLGALVLAGLTLLVFRRPHAAPVAEPGRFAALLVMTVVIMGWSFGFAWLTARKEDEYTLTAAKYAWFWGGLIGLVSSVPVLAFVAWGGLTMFGLAAFGPSRDKAFCLILGYMIAVVFQFAGYVIARVWWGMRRS